MKRMSIALFILLAISANVSAQHLKLFSGTMRSMADKNNIVIMNFLERYFDDIRHQNGITIEQKMADDKVYFRQGKLSDIFSLNDTIPFSISKFDKYFEVSWLVDNTPFVTIVFPAQYELLVGKTQKEIQEGFRTEIMSATAKYHCDRIDERVLLPLNDSIYIAKNEYLEHKSLNNAAYYIVRNGIRVPIFNDSQMCYSAANLFQSLVKDADYKMYIEQSVYGMKTISYNIRLSQWLALCTANNLKMFFAVEEEHEDGIKAIVVAKNSELNYIHLLSVVIPRSFVNNQNTVLKVRLTPYIPIHNLKNLYKKQTVTKKKTWQ